MNQDSNNDLLDQADPGAANAAPDQDAPTDQPAAPQQGDWRLAVDADDIAWLHLDCRDTGTNTLSAPVLQGLNEALQQIENRSPAGVIIVSDKPNGFIAGADIREFTRLHEEEKAFEQIRLAQSILDRLASLTCPTVSVIHGFCLGGGTELALACRYRVALDDPGTRIGLPEVRLGIHPGFGGSVRLTPLLGPVAAMDMMLTGRTVSARAAAKMGLVERAVPQRHLHTAARRVVLDAPVSKRLTLLKRLPNHRLLRPLLARLLRRRVAARAPRAHYPAPYALIDLWRRHADQPRTMMTEEARSVARLMVDDTAQNLIHVFFLQERLKGLGRQSDFKAQHVHVIGAGTMGGDIAAWCVLRGLRVSLQDREPARIAPAVKRAYALFRKRLKQPRLVQAAMDRLMPDSQGVSLAKADVVVEAIFENLEVKQQLFREIEPRMKPDALLATNTSSIPLEELSHSLEQPQRLVGLHFFNPVAKMQLVEVVAGTNTDADVVRHAAAFTRQIDRLPLTVRSTPGFLVNRILMPYLLEAVTLVAEGVPPAIIDRAAVHFGMPMGPVELADTVGLDICLSVAEILSQHLGGEVPDALRDRVLAGKLGRKSGSGFYRYKNGKPVREKPDKGYRAPTDIEDRLILRLLNEAAACLREGVVADGDLLDAGIIFGTGFAPFRGGPEHYARHVGVDALKARCEALRQRYGERFQTDDGWDSLAAAGGHE